MEFKKIKLGRLELNKGQYPGLPENPREWKKKDLEDLARSMAETPELAEARGAVVVQYQNGYVVLGGNMRVEAARLLKWEELMCAVLPADTPLHTLKAIVIKDNGPEPIGSISAVHIKEKTSCATIGYCMSRAHWGKGIMTEALSAVIAFFFDEVGINRVEAEHDPNNPASGRVMEKSGMTFEGTSRQAGLSNQGIIDVSRWAILRCDYEQAH